MTRVNNAWNRVIQLQSNNIYRNLAFEAALYLESERFSYKDDRSTTPTDILLWKSSPCVVIGRFQCAWKECNFTLLRQRNWPVARRQSGGGAVFHDLGNLNVSFVEARSVLDRRKCMEFLQAALQPHLSNRIIQLGRRYDLWLTDADNNENLKFSGSSSRLGSKVAYHHCTLLCNSDLSSLSVLSPTFNSLTTSATQSVRSLVTNLDLNVDEVAQIVVDSAVEWIAQRKPDALSETRVVKIREGDETNHVDSIKFKRLLRELQSWSWIYGFSPTFQLDLAEFEPDLSRLGSFALHCDRGGTVRHLSFTPLIAGSSEFTEFIDSLSDALSGMECRPFYWQDVLERFMAKWQMEHDASAQDPQFDLVVQSLRLLSAAI